jgi:hypothetical protein
VLHEFDVGHGVSCWLKALYAECLGSLTLLAEIETRHVSVER